MKRIISILFALALVLGLSLVAAAPVAAATTYYVATTGNDANPGSSGSPWLTIQHAVSTAASGDTIMVAAGTYDEQVIIDKSLTIQGAGDTTIIQPSSTTVQNMNTYSHLSLDFAPVVFADGISSVTIRELKIDGSQATTFPSGTDRYVGLFVVGTDATADHVTSVNFLNYSGSILGYNMYVYADLETVSVEIDTCSISGVGRGGVQCVGAGLTMNVHDCVVTGPGVRHSGESIANGILIWDGATGVIVDNTVSDFAYDGTGWCAEGIDGTGATSVIGNTVTDCQCGIGVWGDNVSPDPSVTISDNTITATGLVGSEGDGVTGITVDAWAGGTATAVISDNDLSGGGPDDGIRIGQDWDDPDAIDATISDNVIIDWDTGIFIGDSADVIDVTGNEISSSTGGSKGIYIPSTTTVTGITINLNDIAGNNAYGLDNDASGTVDARYNWWGAGDGPGPVGPGSGDKVSANVDYDSWTTKHPTATGTGTASFTPSAGNITVVSAVAEGSLPAAAQATKPINFPDGLFSFNITGLSNGATVTVTITLPPGSAPTQYWKYHASEGGWIQIPMTIVGPPNVIRITLVDGGLGDDDGTALGTIVDQGGPGSGAVGWESYQVSKARVLIPWIALLAAIMAGASLLLLRRRRTQS